MPVITQHDFFSQVISMAKGVSILLVVAGHIASPLSVFIYSFHVPLFFFLGGVYINATNSYTGYFLKGIRRLGFPFAIFGIAGLIATSVKNILLHRQPEPIQDSLFGMFYWMDISHMHHYGFVLWFLPALFWGRLIVFCMIKWFNIPHIVLVTVCVFAAAVGANHLIVLPFALDKGIVALPWVAMGYIFYQYKEKWASVGWYGVSFSLLGLLLLIHFFGVGGLDLATKRINNIFITIPYTLLISLFLIGVLGKIRVLNLHLYNSWLIRFGKNTMMIMIVHVYTNNAASVSVGYVFGDGMWFIVFMLSLLALHIIVKLKERSPHSLVFKYM